MGVDGGDVRQHPAIAGPQMALVPVPVVEADIQPLIAGFREQGAHRLAARLDEIVLDGEERDGVAGEVDRAEDVELRAFRVERDIIEARARLPIGFVHLVEGHGLDRDQPVLADRLAPVLGIAVRLGIFGERADLLRGDEGQELPALAMDGPLKAGGLAARSEPGEKNRVGLDQHTAPAMVGFEKAGVAVQHAVEGTDLGEATAAPSAAHRQHPALLLDLRVRRRLEGVLPGEAGGGRRIWHGLSSRGGGTAA